MPGLFVTAIVFMVIAVLVAIAWLVIRRISAGKDEYERPSVRPSIFMWVSVGLAVLAVVFTLFSSFTSVSTKNIGIVTSFNRPIESLDNGPHFVAPWEKVTELDAAIQTDNHFRSDKEKNGCIAVRIVRQAQACVNTSIRWRLKQDKADQLFKDYRSFDNIRDSLVTRELNAVENSVFDTYDPLGLTETGVSTAPSVKTLSDQATTAIRQTIGDEVDVLNVIISVVYLDDETQKRVDALQAQVAQSRIAEQAIVTARKQSDANRALSQSLSGDPNVLVSKCYDLVGEMLNKGMTPPVAFNCWPGSGSQVVLPSAQAAGK